MQNSIFEHRNDIVLTKVNALNAIEMAREEERKNAVKQLQIVLTAIVARDDNKISFGDIIDQFDKLLNE